MESNAFERIAEKLEETLSSQEFKRAEDFTEEKLASVLFSLMLSALLRQDYDPSTVLEMVRRLIY